LLHEIIVPLSGGSQVHPKKEEEKRSVHVEVVLERGSLGQ
jgi:hypothetical protein